MSQWSASRWALVIGGGILLGLAAFVVTSSTYRGPHLGPLCRTQTISDAQFDPWTGLGRSDVYECIRDDGRGLAPTTTIEGGRPIRTWLGTRHAIPLTVGIPLGWAAVAALLALRDRGHLLFTWRPRRDLSTAMLLTGVGLLAGLWFYLGVSAW